MQLIPIEKISSNRDSIRKAREAFLIQKGRTIVPDGLNIREETFQSFPFTLLCLFTILFLHMFICNLHCQLFYVFPVICYIKTRPDAKFSIVPEEGWFGQPKYSTF